ncbi:MAG: GNAT family N-acetyltransferase [Pseudomonadota bacterium]
MGITVRKLNEHELDWANECYARIDFIASAPSDYIAVAEVAGRATGLGRVAEICHGIGELGGMCVFPEYRGKGIAGLLIDHLIDCAGLDNLYCLPFQELRTLYESKGFFLHAADETVPEKILQKHDWCNHHYRKPVLLMYRRSLCEAA